MRWLNLFKFSYYLDSNLGYTFPGFYLALGIFIGLLLASFYIRKRVTRLLREKLLQRVYFHLGSSSFWLGFGGLLWLFFRFQSIRFFNLRLWPALLFLYFLGSVFYAFYFLRFHYPRLVKVREEKEDKLKFLRMARRKRK